MDPSLNPNPQYQQEILKQNRAVELNLQPHQEVVVPNDVSLAHSSEYIDKLGLGFKGDLKGIIECSPDGYTERFYVFDRGEDSPKDAFSNTRGRNHIFRADERFVVVDEVGLEAAARSTADESSVGPVRGWSTYKTGESVVVGRNDQFAEKQGRTMNKTISRQHVQLRFGQDGIGVTDLDSSLGSRLIMPTGEAPKPIDTDRTLEPAEVEALRRQRIAQKLGEQASGFGSIERVRGRDQVATAERALKGDDTILRNDDLRLYGVFDGVGGSKAGKAASREAAHAVEAAVQMSSVLELSMRVKPKDAEKSLVTAFEGANRTVLKKAGEGQTTATVARIMEYKGNDYAIWASVGDSRLYVYNRYDGKLTEVSTDETVPGQPNVITNALGDGYMKVHQSGHFKLKDGDEMILCSDGITGDKGTDVLRPEEIITVMRASTSVEQSAQGLMDVSRKRDDKSVVVVKAG